VGSPVVSSEVLSIDALLDSLENCKLSVIELLNDSEAYSSLDIILTFVYNHDGEEKRFSV